MDYKVIAKKIEELIKKSIISKGLVKTGRMLNSIQVTINPDWTVIVDSVDYFAVLDKEYKITEGVMNSSEFGEFMAKFINESAVKDINNEISKL